jgi:hypothetical protein
MKNFTVFKTKEATSDGLHVYNFTQIPQNDYVKIHNLFGKDDKAILKKASKMLHLAGELPALVEIEEV